MHDYYIGKLNILLKKINDPEVNLLMCRIAEDFIISRSMPQDKELVSQNKCINFPQCNKIT